MLHLATGATIATVALLWISAYSAHIPPEKHGWLDVLGLCFPIFAAGNAAALLGWLIMRSKRAILPLAGFVCCISDVQAYCPVNIPQPAPKGCLKVLSYNTMNFAAGSGDTATGKHITDYILSSEADIVCIQEGEYYKGWKNAEKQLRKRYPYIATLDNNTAVSLLRCFSRYPIVEKMSLPIISETNCVGIFKIALSRDDTIHVINCHLQSDNLTKTDRENYKSLVKGEQQDGAKTTVFSLVRKLSAAARVRSTQTDSIMQYIERNKEYPMILCGRFQRLANILPAARNFDGPDRRIQGKRHRTGLFIQPRRHVRADRPYFLLKTLETVRSNRRPLHKTLRPLPNIRILEA